MRKEPETLGELKNALQYKFGKAYIPHKLCEEMSELTHALHKILGEHYKFRTLSSEERVELKASVFEEIAHVKIFLCLLEETFKSSQPVIDSYFDERFERLKTKANE